MIVRFADIPPLFFVGELPKELGKLVNLKVLDLRRNGFTGTIVCPVLHSHFGPCTSPRCVCVHSDGRREGGTQGEAPGLRHLVLRCVCMPITENTRLKSGAVGSVIKARVVPGSVIFNFKVV